MTLPNNQDPTESQKQDAGSSKSGEPVFLVAGRLRRPHGVKGEVIMEVITDFPERLKKGTVIYLGDQKQALTIQTIRPHNPHLLLSFPDYNTPEEVGMLRNQLVYVRSDTLPNLPTGEYYHHQLLGLMVVDEDGKKLGTLDQILETGANDVYVVVSPSGEELLLPVIQAVILSVDLPRKEIRVRPPEWV